MLKFVAKMTCDHRGCEASTYVEVEIHGESFFQPMHMEIPYPDGWEHDKDKKYCCPEHSYLQARYVKNPR